MGKTSVNEPAKDWVIWSEEHAAWWGRARWGYTESLAAAGRYSQEEAQAIVRKANFYCKPGTWNECAFPLPWTLSPGATRTISGNE
jgi:hypothetical protein